MVSLRCTYNMNSLNLPFRQSWQPSKDRKRMGLQKETNRKGWSSSFFYPFCIRFLSVSYPFWLSHPFSILLLSFLGWTLVWLCCGSVKDSNKLILGPQITVILSNIGDYLKDRLQNLPGLAKVLGCNEVEVRRWDLFCQIHNILETEIELLTWI